VRRFSSFVLAVLVVACGSEDASVEGSGGSSGGGGASGAGGAAPTGDARTIQRALAGEIAAEAALAEIALSDGFPIAVAGGFLFARLDDGAGPYTLAGDFNGWSPQAMELSSKLYFVVVDIPEPDGKKYKLGNGESELSADPYARRYLYDALGEISLVRASVPHLERFPGVSSSSIPARTVRVWVGSASPTHHLYAHDGQNLFDPEGPFGGWRLDTAVKDTTLVVGIDNGGALRMDEYTHVPDVIEGQSLGGKGDEYSDFVRDVVRPLIQAHYGAPAKTGVMGSSLGGLISFHQALENPDGWDFAASLSGTFGWGSIGAQNETLIERWENAPKLSTKLYLDSGGGPGSGCVDSDGDGTNDDAPDSADNYCETLQLRDLLDASGYVFDEQLFHWYEPGAAHDEAAWAARVFRPVQIFEAL
jgi:hypothetical protein